MKEIFYKAIGKLKLFLIKQLRPISLNLELLAPKNIQKRPEYLCWLNDNLVSFTEEYFTENGLDNSYFLNRMGAVFNTTRFKILAKRWVVDYYYALFNIFYDYSFDGARLKLTLEDNPLNRFAVRKYNLQFGFKVKIDWRCSAGSKKNFFSLVLLTCYIIFTSLKSGIKLFARRRNFKVMREAIWGFYDTGGYFFHDDFLVDQDKLKKEDLVLFSRLAIEWCNSRLKAYRDAKKSGYAHFYLPSLPIDITQFLFRIVPKYIFGGIIALAREFSGPNFSLLQNIYWYFIFYGLTYEKIFSNFTVLAELGHNYFSASHIAESIICQNHKVQYYLMHWSDNSVAINKFASSFLGCDKYFLWGKAHVRGVEGRQDMLMTTGYIFKCFIKDVMNNRIKVIADMNIDHKGKIISFFDESFGNACLMTESHFVNFWETALKVAELEKGNTIVIKPKELMRARSLSDGLKNKFNSIREQLGKMPNVYILDSSRWSFIEIIGISDIVITQGMTTSATIAIICGVEGLYFDQANYSHPFSLYLRNKIIFNDSGELAEKIHSIVSDNLQPIKNIPELSLREYDAFSDERGLRVIRDILTKPRSRVGIIIQARMGSTRLPGKVMLHLEGKSILEHIIERLRHCRYVDEIVLATTVNENDNILEMLARQINLKIFRGDEEDVLSRYYLAAKENNFDIITRITSDCPVIDHEITDKVIEFYLKNLHLDYISNVLNRTLPRGLDAEVFSFQTLQRVYKEAHLDYEREHVTPHIYLNPQKFKIANFKLNDKDFSHYRLTVDTREDFELISIIYKRLYTEKKDFTFNDILGLFAKEPDLVKTNQHIKQKVLQ